jgi:hypothetical protein
MKPYQLRGTGIAKAFSRMTREGLEVLGEESGKERVLFFPENADDLVKGKLITRHCGVTLEKVFREVTP